MFTERLTEHQLYTFRVLTPLSVDGKPIPFRIYCNGKFYDDPRGSSQYIVFLRDFSCRLPMSDKNTKKTLNRHYLDFMRNEFGKEYEEAYSKYLLEKIEEEKNV